MQSPPALTGEPALVLQTLSNLADAMVAAAEAHSDLGQHGQAATLYREAMQAYNRACSLSSSENGDDLPGLLHNWGSGLHSAGSHVRVRLCLAGFPHASHSLPATHVHTTTMLCRLPCAGEAGLGRLPRAGHFLMRLCSADSPMRMGLEAVLGQAPRSIAATLPAAALVSWGFTQQAITCKFCINSHLAGCHSMSHALYILSRFPAHEGCR